jgi:hypothetical protein
MISPEPFLASGQQGYRINRIPQFQPPHHVIPHATTNLITTGCKRKEESTIVSSDNGCW